MKGFEVHVDAAALADMERAEEAARAHAAAMQAAGGKAALSGEHAARISSAGGKATMSGEHAARIHSLGGKAKKIYKNPKQTAAQQARAEYMRKYRAAKRAAESIVRVE